MTEHAGAQVHGHGVASPISVLWVIAASIVAAAGIFMMAMWLLTYDYLYLLGPWVVLLSVLMFLNHRAGLDHA
jgi:hypothetical protein